MKKFVFIALIAIGFMSCSDDDTTVALTQAEEEDLLILREEEKLARDVYMYAFDKYALEISDNISKSEQKHMDKILGLLNKYDLADPALSTRGDFNNNELQTLYNALTTQVDISELEALKVGAIIEDLDIRDIEDFEARTDKRDILNVYDKLKCGSRNHMRTYYSQLNSRDFIYEPQYITSEYLMTIVTSDNEQCGKN